jgi:hypothetical protein
MPQVRIVKKKQKLDDSEIKQQYSPVYKEESIMNKKQVFLLIFILDQKKILFKTKFT